MKGRILRIFLVLFLFSLISVSIGYASVDYDYNVVLNCSFDNRAECDSQNHCSWTLNEEGEGACIIGCGYDAVNEECTDTSNCVKINHDGNTLCISKNCESLGSTDCEDTHGCSWVNGRCLGSLGYNPCEGNRPRKCSRSITLGHYKTTSGFSLMAQGCKNEPAKDDSVCWNAEPNSEQCDSADHCETKQIGDASYCGYIGSWNCELAGSIGWDTDLDGYDTWPSDPEYYIGKNSNLNDGKKPDCDDNPLDDPDVCWYFDDKQYEKTIANYAKIEDKINCSKLKYQNCAKCIKPLYNGFCPVFDSVKLRPDQDYMTHLPVNYVEYFKKIMIPKYGGWNQECTLVRGLYKCGRFDGMGLQCVKGPNSNVRRCCENGATLKENEDGNLVCDGWFDKETRNEYTEKYQSKERVVVSPYDKLKCRADFSLIGDKKITNDDLGQIEKLVEIRVGGHKPRKGVECQMKGSAGFVCKSIFGRGNFNNNVMKSGPENWQRGSEVKCIVSLKPRKRPKIESEGIVAAKYLYIIGFDREMDKEFFLDNFDAVKSQYNSYREVSQIDISIKQSAKPIFKTEDFISSSYMPSEIMVPFNVNKDDKIIHVFDPIIPLKYIGGSWSGVSLAHPEDIYLSSEDFSKKYLLAHEMGHVSLNSKLCDEYSKATYMSQNIPGYLFFWNGCPNPFPDCCGYGEYPEKVVLEDCSSKGLTKADSFCGGMELCEQECENKWWSDEKDCPGTDEKCFCAGGLCVDCTEMDAHCEFGKCVPNSGPSLTSPSHDYPRCEEGKGIVLMGDLGSISDDACIECSKLGLRLIFNGPRGSKKCGITPSQCSSREGCLGMPYEKDETTKDETCPGTDPYVYGPKFSIMGAGLRHYRADVIYPIEAQCPLRNC